MRNRASSGEVPASVWLIFPSATTIGVPPPTHHLREESGVSLLEFPPPQFCCQGARLALLMENTMRSHKLSGSVGSIINPKTAVPTNEWHSNTTQGDGLSLPVRHIKNASH